MSVYYSQPAPRPGGESVFQDATCRIVLFSPFLIVCTAPDTCLSSSSVAAVRRGLDQLSAACAHIGYLVVHDTPFRLGMAPEVRTGLTLTMQRFEERIAGVAVVYEESGFKGTAIRGLMTATHAATRAKHQAKVFAEPRAAFEWLQLLLPESKLSLGELTDFVREQRRRLLTNTPIPLAPASRR